jgi:ribose transport system ATP-binding protein
MTNTTNDNNVLEITGISKSFPGVKALDKVDFSLRSGEVHCLVGENGAGKSTLMKVIAGLYSPDEGQILYKGEKIRFRTPHHAIENGVILIHQELSLVPELSVAENIFLGQLPAGKSSLVDWATLNKQTEEIIDQLGCNFKATDLVGSLSIGYQQMVEIGRALSHEATLVVFDEPTASLTGGEVIKLFENIERLKQQGTAIVYITHKMDEIFKISDRITVLRDGRKTGTVETKDSDRSKLINLMIGRDISEMYSESSKEVGHEVLKIQNLKRKPHVKDISFSVRAGEVLGLYGLVGAGRSEAAEAIFGVAQADEGKIFFEGEERSIPNPKKAVQLGMGFVPENRKEQGLVLGMACDDNMILSYLPYMHRFGFLQFRKRDSIYSEYSEKLSISTPSPKQHVGKLSGGNQQKIVIGKWMALNPKLLILDEPTRGIDVGSKSEIHKLIGQMASEGIAVIVISSEMPEIIGVSDRIITLLEGEVTGEFVRGDVSEKKLLHACAQQ